MESIKFKNYVNRVEEPCKCTAHNPSDSLSSQRLSEESNCVAVNAKKVDFHRFNKHQSVKDFMMNQVATAWREGKCFTY